MIAAAGGGRLQRLALPAQEAQQGHLARRTGPMVCLMDKGRARPGGRADFVDDLVGASRRDEMCRARWAGVWLDVDSLQLGKPKL